LAAAPWRISFLKGVEKVGLDPGDPREVLAHRVPGGGLEVAGEQADSSVGPVGRGAAWFLIGPGHARRSSTIVLGDPPVSDPGRWRWRGVWVGTARIATAPGADRQGGRAFRAVPVTRRASASGGVTGACAMGKEACVIPIIMIGLRGPIRIPETRKK
jgi:hypothetical protein